jgi:hypothetical protein
LTDGGGGRFAAEQPRSFRVTKRKSYGNAATLDEAKLPEGAGAAEIALDPYRDWAPELPAAAAPEKTLSVLNLAVTPDSMAGRPVPPPSVASNPARL